MPARDTSSASGAHAPYGDSKHRDAESPLVLSITMSEDGAVKLSQQVLMASGATVHFPDSWSMQVAEVDGLFSVSIDTGEATASIVVDVSTWERVVSLPESSDRMLLQSVLVIVADERSQQADISSPRELPVSPRDDPATWSRLQMLAAVVGATWFPPVWATSKAGTQRRYRWVYQYRRVNAMIRRRSDG